MQVRFIFQIATIAATFALVALQAAEQPKKSAPGVTPLLDPPGIHNLYSLGTNVFSGGTPEGEQAFAALAKLGVKTIVTVDGAKPQVALAKKYGLRYVHLPHGYDGINTNLQLKLSRLANELPGPVYVHCHHGKHRGPAAAAVICMSRYGWTSAQAEAWLRAAGTATNYTGLYAVVRDFKKPTPEQLSQVPSDFPETAQVSGLIDSMVHIDETWEHLKKIRAEGYQTPKDHPDLQPANEAVILWEHYREAQRLPESIKHGDDFIARLKTAETEVKQAERLLHAFSSHPTPETCGQLDRAFDAITKSCSTCHKTYRDPAGIKASK